MCSKVTVVCLLAVAVAAVQAGYVGHEYAHQNYAFKYGVSDHHTGDIKSQDEHGDGGNVHGSYSLVQPDGVTRVVSYRADPHNGFNADVKYIGHAHHPQTYGHGAAYPGHGY